MVSLHKGAQRRCPPRGLALFFPIEHICPIGETDERSPETPALALSRVLRLQQPLLPTRGLHPENWKSPSSPLLNAKSYPHSLPLPPDHRNTAEGSGTRAKGKLLVL